jgi:hypothetical protein
MQTQNENTVAEENRLDDDPWQLTFPSHVRLLTIETSPVPPNQR